MVKSSRPNRSQLGSFQTSARLKVKTNEASEEPRITFAFPHDDCSINGRQKSHYWTTEDFCVQARMQSHSLGTLF